MQKVNSLLLYVHKGVARQNKYGRNKKKVL